MPRRVKKHQDCGPPAVVWKSSIFHKHPLDFSNESSKGNKPAAFAKFSITPLPKKVDLPQNDTEITLSTLALKIYNLMLLNKIPFMLILQRNQNSFCKSKSTLPQSFGLQRIIEGLRMSKHKAAIVFSPRHLIMSTERSWYTSSWIAVSKMRFVRQPLHVQGIDCPSKELSIAIVVDYRTTSLDPRHQARSNEDVIWLMQFDYGQSLFNVPLEFCSQVWSVSQRKEKSTWPSVRMKNGLPTLQCL